MLVLETLFRNRDYRVY